MSLLDLMKSFYATPYFVMNNPRSYFLLDITLFKYCGNVNLTHRESIFSIIRIFIMILSETLQACSCFANLMMQWMYSGEKYFEERYDFPTTIIFFVAVFRVVNFVYCKHETSMLLIQIEHTIKNGQVFYCREKFKPSLFFKFMRHFDKISIALVVFVVASDVGWWLVPILSKNGQLPFKSTWYPFDVNNYYYLVYASQIFADLLVSLNMFLIYNFYNKVTCAICVEFEILHHSMRNIGQNVSSSLIYGQIKDCKKYHTELLL